VGCGEEQRGELAGVVVVVDQAMAGRETTEAIGHCRWVGLDFSIESRERETWEEREKKEESPCIGT
jgi:hypothetical protein